MDVNSWSLALSLAKGGTRKGVYVVGKEGSVRTHACTLALCPICNRGGTGFVSAVDNKEDKRHPPPWCWRVTNMPWRMQAAGVALSTSQGRGALALSYTNLARIARRLYIVDDTIDF